MALTITIEGTGVINNAEDTTNWGVLGAGGVSISTNAETKIQGSFSVASKIAAGKYGWIYYNYGAAVGSLDFTGANAGEHVYIWFNTTTPGFIDSYANYGLCVRMGTDTSNYRSWIITSSDARGNGYIGGWACAVIDPTKTGSGTDTGTYSASTVNLIGIFYYGNGSSVAQNVFVDTIAVGKGLRIIDTDATGWQEVSDYCNATPTTRVWGMFQEKLGIYFVYGTMYIGDAGQIAVTSMIDGGRVFRFGDWEYATAAGTYANAIGNGFNGIVVEDASGHATTYEETGSFFLGSEDTDTTFNLYGGNEATSITTMDGITWQRILGGFTWGNDADHSATNCVWSNCVEVDLVGAVVVRGCSFKNYAGESASLLWRTTLDVRSCSFIDNNGGANSAAIRHTDGSTTTYYDLIFSNNDWDVYLNHASDNLTINKDGTSNPTTYRSSGTGSVTFIGTKTLAITVVDESNDPIQYAQVYMQKSSPDVYTSHASNNDEGDSTFEVQEAIGTDAPSEGWLIVNPPSGRQQHYMYASKSGSIFTLKTEITHACTGGGTSILLQDSVNDFTAMDIAEGIVVRNVTDGSWAEIDEIVDASNITTTQLKGGINNIWTNGDTYSFHTLATDHYGNSTATIPFIMGQTDVDGEITASHNYQGIKVVAIRVRMSSSSGIRYIPINTTGSITGNFSATIVLSVDTNVD
jgi:hypothetical protein